ncbi:S41 family peptidase [Faecalibacterium sp. An122]|uniref:S41 family peptidase n=1 Tax=Faecalibacterium sp. An122 TaxID=1965551 RepID=UPI000B3A7CE7|nr:S41 family peptidase [Faecalibacterium sp. An122]OUQ33165.1 hypothetical protein B5E67_15045 [Faecalibacterium sp. An122]
MKHRILAALVSAALCISLAGCADALDIPQPTLEELLDEVNAEHQSIQRDELDPTPYLRTSLSLEDQSKAREYMTETFSDYDPDLKLDHSQAVEDVNYLFEACYYAYGLYDYFGGHPAFDAAQEAILHDLEDQDTVTCQQLEQIIASHLGFIKDGHFSINQNHPAPFQIPFFFRQTAFLKTENSYQTVDGKTVESVENHADLDELFKRSISKQGQIVYYPVLLKEAMFDGQSEFEKHTCDEELTVHYTDGTTETLTAEPWKQYFEQLSKNKNTELRQTKEIPVFQFNNFNTEYRDEILDGAEQLKDEPVSMLDLRSNTGGDSTIGNQWLSTYGNTGRSFPSNNESFSTLNGKSSGVSLPDKWISHDNLLILLAGKVSGSAAEDLIENACNLENVLIVGENTFGSLLANAGYIELPNSKCGVTMSASSVFLHPNNEPSEEFQGFEPDLWVPADEAEELAAKLIQRLSKPENE